MRDGKALHVAQGNWRDREGNSERKDSRYHLQEDDLFVGATEKECRQNTAHLQKT